jgi:hypothetical protein
MWFISVIMVINNMRGFRSLGLLGLVFPLFTLSDHHTTATPASNQSPHNLQPPCNHHTTIKPPHNHPTTTQPHKCVATIQPTATQPPHSRHLTACVCTATSGSGWRCSTTRVGFPVVPLRGIMHLWRNSMIIFLLFPRLFHDYFSIISTIIPWLFLYYFHG